MYTKWETVFCMEQIICFLVLWCKYDYPNVEHICVKYGKTKGSDASIDAIYHHISRTAMSSARYEQDQNSRSKS